MKSNVSSLLSRRLVPCVVAAGLAMFGGLKSADAIQIRKIDPRTITDLQVEAWYSINGAPHYDFEVLGTWSTTYLVDVRQATGTWDGTQWEGDFVHLTGTQSCGSVCRVDLAKTDTRTFTDIYVGVWFKVNGVWHTDWESVHTLAGGSWELRLDASQSGVGTWDGTKWVGNFLTLHAIIE